MSRPACRFADGVFIRTRASGAGSAAASGSAPAGPGLALSSDVRATDPCPRSIGISRELPTPFSCTCSAEATTESASVWGTDVYTDDSGLCRSALHAGVISSQGGPITVTRTGGRPLYVGTDAQWRDVERLSQRLRSSMEFKGTAPPPPGPGLCPRSLGISRELPTPFTCRCTAEATQGGSRVGNGRLHGRLRDVPCGVSRGPDSSERRRDHRDARRGASALRRHDAQRREVERLPCVLGQHHVPLTRCDMLCVLCVQRR